MAGDAKEIKVRIKAEYKDSILKALSEITGAVKMVNSTLGGLKSDAFKSVENGAKAAGDEAEKAGQKAKDAGDKTNAAGKRGADGLKQTQAASKSLTQSLSEVTIIAAGIVTAIEKVKDGIAALIMPGYKFNKQMESLELGVAGILMSMTNLHGKTLTLNEAMGVSQEIMVKLKDTAMKIGLPMDAMAEGFQAMLGPGLAAKMTIEQIIELTGTGMKAVKAFGLDNRQIAQEMRDMFSGQITVDSQMGKAMNITSGDIARAKESVGGLYAFLKEKFKGMETIAKAYPDTLSGAMERLKNTVLLGSGEALEGFNNGLKTVVNDLFKAISDVNTETGKIALKPEVKQAFTELGAAVLSIIRSLGQIALDSGPAIVSTVKAIAAALSIVADYSKNIVAYFTAMFVIKGLAMAIGPIITAVKALRTAWVQAGIAMSAAAGAEAATAMAGATAGLSKMKQAVMALRGAFLMLNKANIAMFVLSIGAAVFGDKIFEMAEKLGAKLNGSESSNEAPDKSDYSDAGVRNRTQSGPAASDLTTNADITKEKFDSIKARYDAALASLEADIGTAKASVESELAKLEGEYALGRVSDAEYQKQKANLDLQIARLQQQLAQGKIDSASGLAAEAAPYKTPAEIQNMNAEVARLQPELEAATQKVNSLTGAVSAMGAVAGVTGDAVINIGKEQLGLAYELGGNGITATDCGKFVQDTLAKAGVDIGTRLADEQYKVLEEAGKTFSDRSQLQAGDLIFWKNTYNDTGYKDITHVGMYQSDGKILQASGGAVNNKWTLDDMPYEVAGYGRPLSGAPNFAALRANGFADKSFAAYLDAIEANWKAEMNIHAEKLRAQGKNREASDVEIDMQYYDQEKTLRKNRQFGALADLAETKSLKKARANIDQTFTDIENAKAKFSNDLQNISMDELDPKAFIEKFQPIYDEFNKATSSGLQSAMELNEKVLKDPALREKIRAAMKEAANAGYEGISKVVGVATDNLSLQEAAINNRYTLNGGDSITQARELLEVRKQTADVMLTRLIPALEKYAELTKDPSLVLTVQKMKQEWNNVANAIDPLQQSFRDAAKNGLQEFFETGYKECKTLGDAIRSLFSSIMSEIDKLNAKRLAEALNTSIGDWLYNVTGNASPRSNAEGGLQVGPGTGTSDSILSRLSNGEFVVKAAAVKRVGVGFLNAVNSGFVPRSSTPRFATGGLVGASGPQSLISQVAGPNVGLKVVNVTDPNEVGRYLNSRDGEKVMVNWIKRNAGTVRQIIRK